MSSLILKFDASSGECIISAPDLAEDPWSRVRSAFDFGGGSYTVLSTRALSVPLWSILRCREDLGQAIRKLRELHSISTVVDSAIRNALNEATQRQLSLETAQLPVTSEQVKSRLAGLGFKRTLRDYQAQNVAKLIHLPAGATFSVPGAGKTTEALAYYHLKRQENSRLLVVCPKNAFVVWEEQLEICLPSYSVCRLRGAAEVVTDLLKTTSDVFLINYELVPRSQLALYSFMTENATTLFLDESHRIKSGVDRLYAGAVIALGAFAERKLILTGTPMPNSRGDLLPQFQFLYPELKLTPDEAVSKLQSIFVRTTKDQLDILPAKTIGIRVPMSEAQGQLYQALSKELARLALSLRVNERMLFRRIGRSVMNLLQAASDPALLLDSDIGHHELLQASVEEQSPKIAKACELARSLASRNQKCIIWTTFIENVKQISTLLQDLDAQLIYGGVKVSEDDDDLDSREGRIKRFKESDDTYVLVANPASCAESISLHEHCHNAIYVDRTYNAAHFIQSMDRIHRLGLKPGVETFIYILTSPGTVDESVERRLQQKVQRMGQFLNDQSLTVSPFDSESEDLEQELGLSEIDWADLRETLGL